MGLLLFASLFVGESDNIQERLLGAIKFFYEFVKK